jgi:hypothetical protein
MSVATQPPAPQPRADRRPIYLGLVALAAILVAALVLAAVTLAVHHPARDRHVVSAPRDGRREARLDLVGGVGVVTVRSTDLGGDLCRISTPADSGQAPRVVEQDGSELVSLQAVSGGGPGALDVLLSSAVTWQLRLGGGADEARFDLRNGPVSLVDIASGVSSVELWLPRPSDTVTVRETRGASSFVVHLPAGVPIRARLAGGAGSTVIDGTTRTGLSGGTELSGQAGGASGDGSAGSGGYDLDAIGGLSTLWVGRY